MRRVVAYPGRIVVEAAEVPAPGPGEALVRTLAAGVCGSDLHAAHGRHPFVSLPYRPGHEVVGVIEAMGASGVDASGGGFSAGGASGAGASGGGASGAGASGVEPSGVG